MVTIYDASGKPLGVNPPKPLTGAFCRRAYMFADVFNEITEQPERQLVRYQQPHVVTLLIYNSKLQINATRREYYVYAPSDYKSAVQLALLLWKKWERGPQPQHISDTSDWYPKLEDGAVAEEIDDNTFEEQWRAASARKYRAAGHPGDPFAFTCLDQDVMLYKATDFQSGLRVTV